MYKRMTEQGKTRTRRQVLSDEDDRSGFGTKECPVCHALCFDDMGTCYGCLHNFAADGGRADQKKGWSSESDIGSENSAGPKGYTSGDLPLRERHCDAGEVLSRQEGVHRTTSEDPRGFKVPVSPQEIVGQLEKNSSFSRAISCCGNALEVSGAPNTEEVRFSFKNPNGDHPDRELLEVVISVRLPQRQEQYESLQ